MDARENLRRIEAAVRMFDKYSDEQLVVVEEGLEEQADTIEDGLRVIKEAMTHADGNEGSGDTPSG